MGASQRNKGARGELEFAAALRDALGVECHRRGMYQSQGLGITPDVDWDGCPWWFEAKRGKQVNWRAALAQAITDSERNQRTPVVIARDDHKPAVVVMLLDDWLDLARAKLDQDARLVQFFNTTKEPLK
jgi:hypothetical protein